MLKENWWNNLGKPLSTDPPISENFFITLSLPKFQKQEPSPLISGGGRGGGEETMNYLQIKIKSEQNLQKMAFNNSNSHCLERICVSS